MSLLLSLVAEVFLQGETFRTFGKNFQRKRKKEHTQHNNLHFRFFFVLDGYDDNFSFSFPSLRWCAFSIVLHAFLSWEISSIVVMLLLVNRLTFAFISLNSYEVNFDDADFLLRYSFSVFI